MPQETITGLLDGVEQKGNKTTYKVKKSEARQYPDWYIGYFEGEDDEEGPPNLRSGKWYTFVCNTREKDGKTYLQLKSAALLTHEEHGVQTVQPGIYVQEQEREADPISDEAKKVID